MFSAKLALYGTAMLVKPFVPPIWLPENSSNIWSLLWLSGWLIIQIEPTNFYQSSFPNTLTPKKAKNVIQKRIFFDKRDIGAVCHPPPLLWNAVVSKRRTILGWKAVSVTDINLGIPVSNEDEDYSFGFWTLMDFELWWRNVKTIVWFFFQNRKKHNHVLPRI